MNELRKFRAWRATASLLAGAVLCLSSVTAAVAADKVNTGYFGNVAIKGYDPVAYFTEGAAVEGREEHSYKWLGANWRFANAEHMALFAAEPEKYAPQYGGHCATGMAVHGGLTTDIDPEAWTIVDGKLYLNYSADTAVLMTEGIVTIEKADANWAGVQPPE